MRYAHQGGMNPPVIVVHGSALDHVPASYVRYLERSFLEAFKLQGTPLRIQFKSSHNPYATRIKNRFHTSERSVCSCCMQQIAL
jgi:GTP-binding protein